MAESNLLGNKIAGALYGTAIGDGMGAPVEGWSPEKIASRFNSVDTFLPPTDPRWGKGDGHITDDTLMTEALIRAYIAKADHMDSYDYQDLLALVDYRPAYPVLGQSIYIPAP